jgi:hypothetical protein
MNMNDSNSNPRTAYVSKTWKVRLYGSYGEGLSASTFLGEHFITISRQESGEFTAVIDGEAATIRDADAKLRWGQSSEGRMELISEERSLEPGEVALAVPVAPTERLGNARAHQLHIELGTLGFERGYGCASDALGYTVTSLAALSVGEANLVLVFAYGQWGRVTGQRWAA